MGFGQARMAPSHTQWRALGKKVIVYLERPGDIAYFIATARHHMALSAGTLLADGINMTSLYFGDALAEIDLKPKRSLQANTKPRHANSPQRSEPGRSSRFSMT